MNLNRLNNGSPAANGSQSSVPSLLGATQGARTDGQSAFGSSDDDSASLLRQLTQTLARGKPGGGADGYAGVKDESGVYNSGSLFDSSSGYGGFGSQPGSNSPEPQENQEIEVAENLAGAIIGQQGRGITEIQHLTGASVSVSRRGVYAPGTQNRVVTITGAASYVAKAAMIVRQKIQEAEQRRAAQTSY
ncbi:hypothetical protein EB796_014932 [Bugula neritina]|uniref:K Homology domain-containing protein n=1 Tax=Bugula neritina TaxID=10212 RepID=A0A7J7JMC8_BUGNE|nr:hypothetical protein EB796_014932 [Bugula neritina]